MRVHAEAAVLYVRVRFQDVLAHLYPVRFALNLEGHEVPHQPHPDPNLPQPQVDPHLDEQLKAEAEKLVVESTDLDDPFAGQVLNGIAFQICPLDAGQDCGLVLVLGQTGWVFGQGLGVGLQRQFLNLGL